MGMKCHSRPTIGVAGTFFRQSYSWNSCHSWLAMPADTLGSDYWLLSRLGFEVNMHLSDVRHLGLQAFLRQVRQAVRLGDGQIGVSQAVQHHVQALRIRPDVEFGAGVQSLHLFYNLDDARPQCFIYLARRQFRKSHRQRLDVGVNVADIGQLPVHSRLQPTGLLVGLGQGQVSRNLDIQIDKHAVPYLVGVDVVDLKSQPGGDGSDRPGGDGSDRLG